jgi:hypothetical protein
MEYTLTSLLISTKANWARRSSRNAALELRRDLGQFVEIPQPRVLHGSSVTLLEPRHGVVATLTSLQMSKWKRVRLQGSATKTVATMSKNNSPPQSHGVHYPVLPPILFDAIAVLNKMKTQIWKARRNQKVKKRLFLRIMATTWTLLLKRERERLPDLETVSGQCRLIHHVVPQGGHRDRRHMPILPLPSVIVTLRKLLNLLQGCVNERTS